MVSRKCNFWHVLQNKKHLEIGNTFPIRDSNTTCETYFQHKISRWLVWYARKKCIPQSLGHTIWFLIELTTSLKQTRPFFWSLVKIGYKNVQTILSEHRSQHITKISVHPVSCFNTSSFQQNTKSRPGMLVKISLDCLKEVSPVLSPQNMLLWLDVFLTTMRLMRTNVWWTP